MENVKKWLVYKQSYRWQTIRVLKE
jgi:hypothetical protein